jgi:hypothetical protein
MSNSNSEIIPILQKASEGLLMPSESEYPFEPFVWSGQVEEPLVPKKLLELTAYPQDLPVETVAVDYLFRHLAQHQDWHDEQQKEDVQKYQQLVEVLKNNLSDLQVYRVGERNIDVYIIGKTQTGDLAGLATKVVET